ncbi:5'-deoxynucleotidase HDDC2-like isoform X2 [Stegodyphus dumicola]|nr:5'-deoxynucleotidase HDDC2-like isoform X2 [Stegodyphus dumicola]XP_035227351.1 5'-deoxynucleotidase HDDC2-like isoform X2 [Stegodyphus dumicola]
MAENDTSSTSSLLEFFMLIGKLKHLKRTGWVLRNIPECESIAGHMYRMSIMAFLLRDELAPALNTDRCIKMALVHDMAECIVGDLTPFCGISKEEKHRKEMEAMQKLCSLVGEEIGKEFMHLFEEYENQTTAEAKAVKDLDKFDMILQAYEYEKESTESLSLQGFFDNTEGTFRNPAVIKWVEELKRLRSMTLHETQALKSDEQEK